MDAGSLIVGFVVGLLSSAIVGFALVARPSIFVEVEFGPDDLPYLLTVINPGPLRFFLVSLSVTPDGFDGYYLRDSLLFREKELPPQRPIKFQLAKDKMGARRDFEITYKPMIFGRRVPIRMRSHFRFDLQAHSVQVVSTTTVPIESGAPKNDP